MEDSKKDNLTEIWLRRIKNNPLVAVLIIFSIAIVGIATFTESASKLYQLIFPTADHEAKTSASSTYAVEIMAIPSTVNHGAKLNPHGVTLKPTR